MDLDTTFCQDYIKIVVGCDDLNLKSNTLKWWSYKCTDLWTKRILYLPFFWNPKELILFFISFGVTVQINTAWCYTHERENGEKEKKIYVK